MDTNKICDEGVQLLIQRVVQLALYDYRDRANTALRKCLADGITDPDELLESVTMSVYGAFRWFRSEWFYTLTGVDNKAAERAYISYIKAQIDKRLQ